MSARDDLNYVMDETFGIAPCETSSFFDAYRDEILREAAGRIRSEAVQQYDQDSPPITYDEYRGMRRAARLIDPEVKS